MALPLPLRLPSTVCPPWPPYDSVVLEDPLNTLSRLEHNMNALTQRLHTLERYFAVPSSETKCGRCGSTNVAVIRGALVLGEGFEVEACTHCIKRVLGPSRPRPIRAASASRSHKKK